MLYIVISCQLTKVCAVHQSIKNSHVAYTAMFLTVQPKLKASLTYFFLFLKVLKSEITGVLFLALAML